MTPQERGARNEARFFDAAKRLLAWDKTIVEEVRQSPPALDARGIDGTIKITLPKGTKKRSMTVPVEVKSSKQGVAKWKVVHKEHHEAGVLIFYILDEMPERKLCKLIYDALWSVHKNSSDGMLYASWWQRVFKGRGSKRLQENVELIKKERERRKKLPRVAPLKKR